MAFEDSGNGRAGTKVTNDEFFWKDVFFFHVANDGTNGETVGAVALDFIFIGEIFVDSVILS